MYSKLTDDGGLRSEWESWMPCRVMLPKKLLVVILWPNKRQVMTSPYVEAAVITCFYSCPHVKRDIYDEVGLRRSILHIPPHQCNVRSAIVTMDADGPTYFSDTIGERGAFKMTLSILIRRHIKVMAAIALEARTFISC